MNDDYLRGSGISRTEEKNKTLVLRDYCPNHSLELRNNNISPIWLTCNKPTIILWTYVKHLKQDAL